MLIQIRDDCLAKKEKGELKQPRIPNSEMFLADIQEALSKFKGSYEKWTIVDTDDPCDLILAGTEVDHSCQNIYGKIKMNKCLLAYLVDGKHRMVAIKNESGQIQARCIIRILWDSENKTPVLFQEQIYFRGEMNSELSNALDQMCEERAKKLGIPLLSSYQGSVYEGAVQSLGGKAPHEYVDATMGKERGDYHIRIARVR